jgi:hypothetical protein
VVQQLARVRRAIRIAVLSESHGLAPVSKKYGKRDTREHSAHFVPPNRAIASPTTHRLDGQSLPGSEYEGEQGQIYQSDQDVLGQLHDLAEALTHSFQPGGVIGEVQGHHQVGQGIVG